MARLIPVIPPRCTWVHGRTPLWEKAWPDSSCSVYGHGIYLHLPYWGPDLGDDPVEDYCVKRVFCHLQGNYVLVKEGAGWYWRKVE